MVLTEPTLISSSAVSLSTAALHAALMAHLEEKGIMSAEDQRAVYVQALELLESDPADDGGITELARELIEQQLQQNHVRQQLKNYSLYASEAED